MGKLFFSEKKDNHVSDLITYFFFVCGITILIYVFYKSEIVYKGLKSDFYFKYYLASIALIVFSVVSFFLKKELKINFFLIFVSIVFSLYLIELFATLHKISKYDSKYYKFDFQDKRTKYQVYQDLKKSGKKPIVPVYGKNLFSTINGKDEMYAFSGVSNTTTIFCNENGYWVIYKSDRYGFNNPDEVWDKQIFEFVLIGDSFVHGWCVNEKDTIAGNLRLKNDRNGGVLNLGYGGNGPLTGLGVLKEYLPHIKARNVLWFHFGGNDLKDLKWEISNKIIIKYLDQDFDQNLIKRQNEIDIGTSQVIAEALRKIKPDLINGFGFFVRKFPLIEFIKLKIIRMKLGYILNINLLNIAAEEETIPPILSEILYKVNNLVEKHNGKLYFVFLPKIPGVYNKNLENIINNHEAFNKYKKLLNIVKNLNIPIIDIHKEVFDKHPDPLSLFPSYKGFLHSRALDHYNEKGYRLVAETILDKIN